MTGQMEVKDEKNVYEDVYRLLIAGMLVSVTFFVVGLTLTILHPQQILLSPDWIRSHYRWTSIKHGLIDGDSTMYLMIATVLLILTPVARVIVSIYAFFQDRDYKYVAVTSVVLAVMIVTVMLGMFGLR
jgi:uncharacterized membrane protein